MIAVLMLLASTAHAVERPAPLPDPLPRVAWKAPRTEVATLSNGLEVVIVRDPELPTFDVRLLVGVGEYVDPAEKVGLVKAAFDLATAGTATRSADDLSGMLRRLGASLDGELWSGHTGVIRATGLTRNLEETLDLWADVIRAPSFPAQEVDTWRAQEKANLERNDLNPGFVAGRAFWRLVYGDGYIGRSPTTATLDAITSKDLAAIHARHVGPENATILVGGDLTKDQIVPLLEARLGDWKPAGTAPAPVAAKPLPHEPALYFIDSPGAAQTQIWTGTTVGAQVDPDAYALRVANLAFGEAFTGRLNMNLREDKGYTYGARCNLNYLHGDGQLACSTSVQTDVTGPAMKEIRNELLRMLGDGPLSEDEVARAKTSLTQQWPMQLETLEAKLDEQVEIWRYDLPGDWVARFVPGVQAVTTSAANTAFRRSVATDRTFWLVVGDGAKIRPELDAFGLKVVELDAYGNPKG